MTTVDARRITLMALLVLASGLPIALRAQSGSFSSESIVVGTGGYTLNIGVFWTCDDDPMGTTSFPGQVDLVDPLGNLAGQVTLTASGTTPSVAVTGAGSVSNIKLSIHITGASGSPADGNLHATWNIGGIAPGSYTLRFWFFTAKVASNPVSAVTTNTLDSGGGGAPVPTPTPSNALPHTVAYALSHTHADTVPSAYADSFSDTHALPHGHTDPNAYTHAVSHTHADASPGNTTFGHPLGARDRDPISGRPSGCYRG